jgi:hypothetical protein
MGKNLYRPKVDITDVTGITCRRTNNDSKSKKPAAKRMSQEDRT